MATSTMRRAFGVKVLNSKHNEIRRLKREGYVAEIHGNKFWNTSYLMMDYLRKNPLADGARVLEIGCGWGLLGIYCAREFGADVTGIDADGNVLPYLDLHAKINGVEMEGKKMTFQQLSVDMLREYDVILGVEICFWDELTRVLYNLINRSLKAGVGEVIIADPCRPPFNDLVEKCKKRWPARVDVEEKWLKRPVTASGDILIVRS